MRLTYASNVSVRIGARWLAAACSVARNIRTAGIGGSEAHSPALCPAVLCYLKSLENVRLALLEVLRVTRPGGSLVISMLEEQLQRERGLRGEDDHNRASAHCFAGID